mgnify:CR=1 FL=1
MVEAFYDSNALIAYPFGEEKRFEVARKILEELKSRVTSIITIHEIYVYSLKYALGRSFENKRSTQQNF